ncbi:MAG: S8 family serine peptidase [Actinomycetia bacterium]|nr:S8 family serine peptidase [Actinomycetes bacterium]
MLYRGVPSVMTVGRLAVATIVAATLLVAAPSAAVAGEPKPLAIQPGEVVVKIERGATIDAIHAEYGTEVITTLLGTRGVYLLSVPIDTTKKPKDQEKKTKDLAKKISKEDHVVYAEPNFVTDVAEGDRFHAWPESDRFHAWPGADSFIPWPDDGGVEAGSSPAFWTDQPALEGLGLDEAHEIARGGGVTVAVLDTGVDLDHGALVDHLADGGYDYVDDDAVPNDDADGVDSDGDGLLDEAMGHGTHVAGIVALVAPDAQIWPARVLDSNGHGSVFLVAEAIHDAIAADVDVINLSFGIDRKVESKLLAEAIKAAKEAGVLVVAAAGNDGSGAKHYPAAGKDIIGVAAMDHARERLAAFSSHGKWVTVAAPGEAIVSPVPGGFAIWSGTSMAAPFVSGQAALLISLDRGASFDKVRKAIAESADKIDDGPKVEKGIIDIVASLVKL